MHVHSMTHVKVTSHLKVTSQMAKVVHYLTCSTKQQFADLDYASQVLPNMQFSAALQMYALTCGCSKACLDALPDLVFTLGNKKYPLTAESYIIKVRYKTNLRVTSCRIICNRMECCRQSCHRGQNESLFDRRLVTPSSPEM